MKKKNFSAVADFADETLQKEWEAWQQHRRERRNALTPIARGRQLNKLRKIGVERAVAALRHSIENGYQGIFEPRDRQVKNPLWAYQKREARMKQLNERRAELMRMKPRTPAIERELSAIQIERYKL